MVLWHLTMRASPSQCWRGKGWSIPSGTLSWSSPAPGCVPTELPVSGKRKWSCFYRVFFFPFYILRSHLFDSGKFYLHSSREYLRTELGTGEEQPLPHTACSIPASSSRTSSRGSGIPCPRPASTPTPTGSSCSWHCTGGEVLPGYHHGRAIIIISSSSSSLLPVSTERALIPAEPSRSSSQQELLCLC